MKMTPPAPHVTTHIYPPTSLPRTSSENVDNSNENKGSPSPVEIINTCDEPIVQTKELNIKFTHEDNNLAVLNKSLELAFLAAQNQRPHLT